MARPSIVMARLDKVRVRVTVGPLKISLYRSRRSISILKMRRPLMANDVIVPVVHHECINACAVFSIDFTASDFNRTLINSPI